MDLASNSVFYVDYEEVSFSCAFRTKQDHDSTVNVNGLSLKGGVVLLRCPSCWILE